MIGYFLDTMTPFPPNLSPLKRVEILNWTRSRVTVRDPYGGRKVVRPHVSSYGRYFREEEYDEAVRQAKQYWVDRRQRAHDEMQFAADMIQRVNDFEETENVARNQDREGDVPPEG